MAHRGLVHPSGKVRARCTAEFLHLISLEILRIRSQALVGTIRTLEVQDYDRRRKFITYEVNRLLRHPSLFPSETAYIKFVTLLGSDTMLQFGAAVKKLLLREEARQIRKISHQEYTRPRYVPGSKGWECFLLADAPGGRAVKFADSESDYEATLQLLPVNGAKIVSEYQKEESDLLLWVRNTRDHMNVTPAATTMNVDFDCPNEPLPNIQVLQKTHGRMLRPNPYVESLKLELDIPDFATDDLTELNTLISRLEWNGVMQAGLSASGSDEAATFLVIQSKLPEHRVGGKK